MVSQSFPSQVPVCTSIDQKISEYQAAKDDQRPFLAVLDEEDMPGWRAMYNMNPTGEGREGWYELSDPALNDIKEHHELFIEDVEPDTVVEKCSAREGALHGLSKSHAKDLANRFADIVWETDNLEKITPKEYFDRQNP